MKDKTCSVPGSDAANSRQEADRPGAEGRTDPVEKKRKDLRRNQAVVTAKELVKSYSLLALGEGKKKGGGVACQKTRFKALERVRAVAQLSPEQRNDLGALQNSMGYNNGRGPRG